MRFAVPGPAANGSYTFTLLQPGTYKVTVSMAGFKSFLNPGLVLAAGDRARIDAPLQIGDTNQTVEVTAEPSALQTDSTNVGSSIEARAISDLPLNGRNVFGPRAGRTRGERRQSELTHQRYPA